METQRAIVKQGKSVSVYNCVQSRLPTEMSTMNAVYHYERKLTKALYVRMQIRNTWEWSPPKEESDIVVRRAPSSADEVGFVSDLNFSQDGRRLAASSTNSSIYVFEPNTGKMRVRIGDAHGDAVSKVKFVSDTQLVSGSADCTIALWDLRKPTAAVNILRGHGKPIRSLDFFHETDMLVSSALDGQVCYWHLPHFQATRSENKRNSDEESTVRGILFSCQNFVRMCATDKMIVCTNSKGTIHVIENLDLLHLKHDLKNVRFDESISMQLSWFNPNASLKRRNRIRVFEADEYSPLPGSLISNITHISFHPTMHIMLMRISTSTKNQFRQMVRDWTCICDLKQRLCIQNGTNSHFGMSCFGANILEEILLFASEETRFASFREKKLSFTSCGRVIASPDKFGFRLLAFSGNLDTCDNVQSTVQRSNGFASPAFWPTGPKELTVIGKLERPTNSTTCCKFSPFDMILAIGDCNCHVSFYQPKI